MTLRFSSRTVHPLFLSFFFFSIRLPQIYAFAYIRVIMKFTNDIPKNHARWNM